MEGILEKPNIVRQLTLLGLVDVNEKTEDVEYVNKRQSVKRKKENTKKTSKLVRTKNKKKLENDTKLAKKLDQKLYGMSKNLLKKHKKKAIAMGFDGCWRLQDILLVNKEENYNFLKFPMLLEWFQTITEIVSKLHEIDICMNLFSINDIFINRDLEIVIFQHDEIVKSSDKVQKDLDNYLLGIALLQSILFFYGCEFDFQKTYLKKVEILERRYLNKEKVDENLQEIQFLVKKELRKLIKDINKANDKSLHKDLIELITLNCSPVNYKRKNPKEIIESLIKIRKSIDIQHVKEDYFYTLSSLLLSKILTSKIIHISEIKKKENLILDSLLPIFASKGLFDCSPDLEDYLKSNDETTTISNDSYLPETNTTKSVQSVDSSTKSKVNKDSLRKMKDFHKASNTKIQLLDTQSENLEDFFENEIELEEKAQTVNNLSSQEENIDQAEALKLDTLTKHEASKILATMKVDPEGIALQFDKQELLQQEHAIAIIRKATKYFKEESNMLTVEAPVSVVGDIHGQYWDLREMFKLAGNPEEGANNSFVFLGDYVDRGNFSCEVFLYLCALKVKYPERVWMLRGNHESRAVSSHFGFKNECFAKYGGRFFNTCALAFQALPIAALVKSSLGNWLCLHGGISSKIKTLDQIIEVDRFSEPLMDTLLCDLVWSDPVTDESIKKQSKAQYEEIDYTPNYIRGCSCRYGYKALKDFLKTNKLLGIVRGHEVQQDGYKIHFEQLHKRYRDTPIVLTVFSAPNYCGRYGNKGAFIEIKDENPESVNSVPLGAKLHHNSPFSSGTGTFRRKKIQGGVKESSRPILPSFGFTLTRKQKIKKSRSIPFGTLKRNKKVGVAKRTLRKAVMPLDYIYVRQYDAVDSPQPVQFQSAVLREHFNIQQICPYIPTDCATFIGKVAELYKAKVQIVNQTQRKSFVPNIPPAILNHGAKLVTRSGRNWRAQRLMNVSQKSSENLSSAQSSGTGAEPRKLRFERAFSTDSINEINPDFLTAKVKNAENALENGKQDIPTEIYVYDEDDEREGRNSEEDRTSFTKTEILALKALFLLIDRRDKGEIAREDFFVWAQDHQVLVSIDEINMTLYLLAGKGKDAVNFRDFLLFASKCKSLWLKRKVQAIQDEATFKRHNSEESLSSIPKRIDKSQNLQKKNGQIWDKQGS